MNPSKTFEPLIIVWTPLKVLIPLKIFLNHSNIFYLKIKFRIYIGIGIGSLSADMKKTYIGKLSDRPILRMGIIGMYRYRPIWKKAYRSYTAGNRVLAVQVSSILTGYTIASCNMWLSYESFSTKTLMYRTRVKRTPALYKILEVFLLNFTK